MSNCGIMSGPSPPPGEPISVKYFHRAGSLSDEITWSSSQPVWSVVKAECGSEVWSHMAVRVVEPDNGPGPTRLTPAVLSSGDLVYFITNKTQLIENN